MVSDFAERAGLPIEWLNVFRTTEALEAVMDGRADLSISPLPIDHRDDPGIAASEPIGLERFRLIGRHDSPIDGPLALDGVSVAVKLSSPMWPYLDRLQGAIPDLRLQVLPDDLTAEAVQNRVANGTYDAALVAATPGARIEHPRLRYLFDVTDLQPVTWYTRADRSALLGAVNRFIARYHTEYQAPDERMRKFRDVQRDGRLRVITRLDEGNYFVKRGRPAGFELGLARRFAARHGLKLEVLVGRDEAEIVRWLKDGVGDVITTRIDEGAIHGDPGFTMSRDYRFEAAVLVSHTRREITDEDSLAGAFLAAYAGSPKLEAVRQFAGTVATVVPIRDDVPLARALEHVENGIVDGVVVDANDLGAILATHPDLRAGPSVPNPYRYRWTLRGNDRELADAVDAFIEDAYRQETYNVLERQYSNARTEFDDISPYDELLRTYSDRYAFDWRLIAAQMYQESHFDPGAVSTAGALGLMQLMPDTARSLGFDDPTDPEAGIHAGVKYLNRLRNRFERHIPMSERTWLALAAYNIGYDRVRRARALAREQGLDPDKWFGSVEVAMRDMARRGAAGGCRCGQAVVYVRSIRSLYSAYRNVVLAQRVARPARHGRALAAGRSGDATAG